MERLKTGSEVTDSEGDWISSGKLKDVPGASKGDPGLAQTTYLYIQMEYCPRWAFNVHIGEYTLFDKIDMYSSFWEEVVWTNTFFSTYITNESVQFSGHNVKENIIWIHELLWD